MNNLRVILIGGSSNIGKSTVAQFLARKIGCSHLSTDSLARHPGRPWKQGRGFIPDYVVEHYASLSVDELITDVLHHYRRIWPIIETIIAMYARDETYDRLILEGSALWPESVAKLEMDKVQSIWLKGDRELFKKRIYHESRYTEVSIQEQYLIDQFLRRTIRYNQKMTEVINALGLDSLEVAEGDSPEFLSDLVFKLLIK
jgi:2-phosphoglycerate kinase